jgi:phosphoglycerate dehydrogenase-like enzyme
MAVKVLVTHRLGEEDLARVRAVSDAIALDTASGLEESLQKAADAEVIQPGAWSDQLWKAAPNLKWVQSGGAGVEHYMTPDFIASPIMLTNAQGTYAIPIADHVMAFVLYFARRFDVLVRNQLRREWADWGAVALDELGGKTLGIVGLGGIGAEVARRAKAFDMRVIATRRRPNTPCGHANEVRGVDGLHWLLQESDYVLLSLALTRETTGLIAEAELKSMKPTAYLMNVGRGGLVDEDALVRALREGEIAGAGLDVFAREPLPEDSPLWEMPNVMITPHDAGDSPRSHERLMDLFCENLRRYVAGEALLNVVDKEAGY